MTSFLGKIDGLAAAFAAAGIPHAFGGALALAFCVGAPRATADIDVNVFVDPERVEEVFAALPPEVDANATAARLVRRDGQVRLWWDETPLDLFFSYHELHESAARATRRVPFGDVELPVLSCTHLAVFKVLFDRTRDWADLEAMAEAGTVDRSEALVWLDATLGPDADPVVRFRGLVDRPANPEPNLRRLLRPGDQA